MMKCFLSSYFQLLYLLIASLLECKAQTERLCEQVHQLDINCFQGDNVSVSCLTTTDPLESLKVKLRRTNQDKDILMYPDISPEPEHQRWSVRKDAGNVTLDLKDIKSSDGGLYDCQIYKDQDCFHATQFNLNIIKCKMLDSVHPTSGSSVLLPCSEHPLQNRTEQVTWKVVTGHKPTDIDNYHLPKKSSSKEKLPNPLYERVRKQANGSLLIRDVVHTDESWYQCRVNEKTCYEVKLLVKANNTSQSTTVLETLSTALVTRASAESPFGHAESNSNKNETVTVNLTVVVMTTIMFLCVFISLTVCVILYFKKQRHKTNSQTQLNGRFSVYYSQVAEEFDVPLYSLVEHNTATMTTFGVEQSEAPECKADDMYENVIL